MMSFFVTSAILSVKRFALRPSALFLAVLLVAASLAGALFYGGEQEVLGIRVGVLFEPEDSFAHRVFARLLAYESPLEYEWYPLLERESVEGLVITGELECAYILKPGLQEDIVYGRAREGIPLLRSPGSVVDSLSSEMVYAAVLGEKTVDMTAELLRDTLGYDAERAALVAAERVAHYEEQDIFLEPEFHYVSLNGGEDTPPPVRGSRLLHGIIALFLLAGTLWSLPPLIRERTSLARALQKKQARIYSFGVAAALALTQLATGLLGLGAVLLVYPAAVENIFLEAVWLLFYALTLGICGTALTRLCKKEDAIFGGGVFLMILSALLGGVMLDLAEIGPLPELVSRAFVTTGYLSGIVGGGSPLDTASLFVFMGLGAVILALPAPRS